MQMFIDLALTFVIFFAAESYAYPIQSFSSATAATAISKAIFPALLSLPSRASRRVDRKGFIGAVHAPFVI
jgi:hypothetical protein